MTWEDMTSAPEIARPLSVAIFQLPRKAKKGDLENDNKKRPSRQEGALIPI
jgi:hypothetical protein